MLLLHCTRRAADLAICTAGSSNDINTEMMLIDTSNSMIVNPLRFNDWFADLCVFIRHLIRLIGRHLHSGASDVEYHRFVDSHTLYAIAELTVVVLKARPVLSSV